MQSAPSLGPRPLRPNSPPLPAIAITLIDIVARFLVALGSGGGGATSVGAAAAAFPLASLSLVLVPIHRHRLGPPPCDVRNGARVPAPFLRVSRMWSGAAVVAGAGAAGRGSRHRCPFRDDNLWTEFSVGRFGAAVEGRGVLYDEDDAGYRRRHGLARNCQRRERKESRERGSHAPLQAHVLPTGASFPVRSARARGVRLRCRDSFPGRCIAEGRKGVRLGDGGGKEQRRHRAVRAAQSCHCHRGVARRQRGHGDVGLDRTIRRIVHLPARGATADPITEYGMLSQTLGGGDLTVLDQLMTANALARLRGEEFTEITWENRLGRRAHGCDGSTLTPVNGSINKSTVRLDGRNHRDHDVLFHLGLRQSALLVAHAHARGCSTLANFPRRTRNVRVLVHPDWLMTVPLMIRIAAEGDG